MGYALAYAILSFFVSAAILGVMWDNAEDGKYPKKARTAARCTLTFPIWALFGPVIIASIGVRYLWRCAMWREPAMLEDKPVSKGIYR